MQKKPSKNNAEQLNLKGFEGPNFLQKNKGIAESVTLSKWIEVKIMMRTLTGFGCLLGMGFLVGWMFSSIVFGFLVLFLMGVLGPVLALYFNGVSFRSKPKSKSRLDWSKYPELADEYLHHILWKPGPRPEFWVRSDSDAGILYLGVPFGGWHREIVVVTSSWLQLPTEKKIGDFQKLWSCIQFLTPFQRRLIGFQMALWASVMSPFSVLVAGFHFAFEWMGFRELPAASFWIQSPLSRLKKIWFGVEVDLVRRWNQSFTSEKYLHISHSKGDKPDLLNLSHRGPRAVGTQQGRQKIRMSPRWAQLEVGPWILGNPVDEHPLWRHLF